MPTPKRHAAERPAPGHRRYVLRGSIRRQPDGTIVVRVRRLRMEFVQTGEHWNDGEMRLVPRVLALCIPGKYNTYAKISAYLHEFYPSDGPVSVVDTLPTAEDTGR